MVIPGGLILDFDFVCIKSQVSHSFVNCVCFHVYTFV